jgi:hypothetical protein
LTNGKEKMKVADFLNLKQSGKFSDLQRRNSVPVEISSSGKPNPIFRKNGAFLHRALFGMGYFWNFKSFQKDSFLTKF